MFKRLYNSLRQLSNTGLISIKSVLLYYCAFINADMFFPTKKPSKPSSCGFVNLRQSSWATLLTSAAVSVLTFGVLSFLIHRAVSNILWRSLKFCLMGVGALGVGAYIYFQRTTKPPQESVQPKTGAPNSVVFTPPLPHISGDIPYSTLKLPLP